MGFPMGCPDLLLPLRLIFLLGHLRRLLYCFFAAVGLADLLDSDAPWPEHTATTSTFHPEFRSVTAMLIQEVLPVVSYNDLVREDNAHGHGHVASAECAVCLYELEGDDEVRRLTNCRHVFHRCCLDRWIEHDQRTCPLCRATLLPEDMVYEDAFDGCVWAAAGIPDSYEAAAAGGEGGFWPFESASPELFFPRSTDGTSVNMECLPVH